jgi:hypothetical protein
VRTPALLRAVDLSLAAIIALGIATAVVIVLAGYAENCSGGTWLSRLTRDDSVDAAEAEAKSTALAASRSVRDLRVEKVSGHQIVLHADPEQPGYEAFMRFASAGPTSDPDLTPYVAVDLPQEPSQRGVRRSDNYLRSVRSRAGQRHHHFSRGVCAPVTASAVRLRLLRDRAVECQLAVERRGIRGFDES